MATYSDNFDRAAENPIASPWTSVSSTLNCRLNASAMRSVGAAGVAQYLQADLSATGDQWVSAAIGIRAGGSGRLLTRISAAGVSYYTVVATTSRQLYRVSAGNAVLLVSAGIPGTSENWVFQSVGAVHALYVDGVFSLSANDTAYVSGGLGAGATGANDANMICDNWWCSAIALPVPGTGGGHRRMSRGLGR